METRSHAHLRSRRPEFHLDAVGLHPPCPGEHRGRTAACGHGREHIVVHGHRRLHGSPGTSVQHPEGDGSDVVAQGEFRRQTHIKHARVGCGLGLEQYDHAMVVSAAQRPRYLLLHAAAGRRVCLARRGGDARDIMLLLRVLLRDGARGRHLEIELNAWLDTQPGRHADHCTLRTGWGGAGESWG
eukprot:scaffold152133_cov32-Tisochrysis_lutea.AAC.1